MATSDITSLAQVLQIISIKGVGPATFWKNFSITKSISKTYEQFASRHNLQNLPQVIERIQNYQTKGIYALGFWQKDYPLLLKRLNHYPPILWFKGNKEFFNKPSIAIVGGRNASFHGIRFANYLGESLSKQNICIISGLARGVDTSAHTSASTAKGGTAAVLAGGVDCLYPKENYLLYNSLCENHLVLSEMPPGTEPSAELFPRRNRLIAGLSSGICIIEAAFKSGSLITANYGLELGLPIFACPGHPYDPRSKGCNILIKQGAYLLEVAEDVLEHLDIFSSIQSLENIVQSTIKAPEGDITQQILNMLSHTPTHLDDIFQKFPSHTSQSILIILGDLEMQNIILKKSDYITLI